MLGAAVLGYLACAITVAATSFIFPGQQIGVSVLGLGLSALSFVAAFRLASAYAQLARPSQPKSVTLARASSGIGLLTLACIVLVWVLAATTP